MRTPKRPFLTTLLAIVMTLALGTVVLSETPVVLHEELGEYLSPSAVLVVNTTIYIATETGKQIIMFNTDDLEKIGVIELPQGVRDLTASPNGTLLYAAAGLDDGNILVIDLEANSVINTIPVGHTPYSPTITADGLTLYVANRFTDDISVVDLENNKEIKRIPVLRQPIALSLTLDEEFLYVANHLPAEPADTANVAAAISIINTNDHSVISNLRLANGSTALRDITISPDGRYVYTTHVLSRYQFPITQLDRGWMTTNAISIVDTQDQKVVNTVLLDATDKGAPNPWGIASTNDYLIVTHSGDHELSLINRIQLHERLDLAAQGERVSQVTTLAEHVPNDLRFLHGIRERVALTGKGPRAINVSNDKVLIAEYFTDSLSIVDLTNTNNVAQIKLGNQPLSEIRRGELLFHDASIAYQQWQSCASCHPDARVDGFNWPLLGDGVINPPMNTITHLFSHYTPPAGPTGGSPNAEEVVRGAIAAELYVQLPEEDAMAIDEYMKSLRPVPSPYLVNGELSDKALLGKEIFDTSCIDCHSGPYFTDGQTYDVGTGLGRNQGVEFVPPSLREVWRTAPYLHDGRSYHIEDAIREHNEDARSLNDEELSNLTEYVLSL